MHLLYLSQINKCVFYTLKPHNVLFHKSLLNNLLKLHEKTITLLNTTFNY